MIVSVSLLMTMASEVPKLSSTPITGEKSTRRSTSSVPPSANSRTSDI